MKAPAGKVYRGQNPSVCNVAIIPARYKNAVAGNELSGYRVQFMSETMGDTHNEKTFMTADVENKLEFVMMLLASAVQPDTNVVAKFTWLDIWAAAGGLFGAVAAAVVVF